MKTIHLFFTAALFFFTLHTAQCQTDITTSDTTCMQADSISDHPVFPGCEDVSMEERMTCMSTKVLEVIRKHIKYPREALEMNVSGKVVVQFVVETDGSISNVHAISYSPPDKRGAGNSEEGREALKKAAVSAVEKLPEFTSPGNVDGKPVRVYLSVPITFTLN